MYKQAISLFMYNNNVTTMKAQALNPRYIRANYWRCKRLLFPSHAEIRFVELMGGKLTRFGRVKYPRSQNCLVIVWSLGRVLNRHKYKREVRIGRYYVDFANDLNAIIEIDGARYHNILLDQERDAYITNWCYNYAPKESSEARILRVPAIKLYNSSAKTQARILDFILK